MRAILEIDTYKQENKGKELPPCELRKHIFLDGEKAIKETEEGLEMDFIISTNSVDRDQDVIAVDGWDCENFQKNPVVLWAHDYRRPPVGKSLSIWVQDDKLKSKMLFMTKDLSSFAHSVGQMYAKGFLNAVSVGFKALEARWSPDEENRPWGIDCFKQELLEYSCVPVPANPEALVDAKSKGIDVAPIFDWACECLESASDALPKEAAERIYSVLKIKTISAPGSAPVEAPKKNGLFLLQKQIQINENRRKFYV